MANKVKIHAYPKSQRERILCDQYKERLLAAKIRLREIPVWLMRTDYGWELYVAAFRADRGLSKKNWYETDLCILREELELLPPGALKQDLERMYADNLQFFKEYWVNEG